MKLCNTKGINVLFWKCLIKLQVILEKVFRTKKCVILQIAIVLYI